jgi:hypothetical protein
VPHADGKLAVKVVMAETSGRRLAHADYPSDAAVEVALADAASEGGAAVTCAQEWLVYRRSYCANTGLWCE